MKKQLGTTLIILALLTSCFLVFSVVPSVHAPSSLFTFSSLDATIEPTTGLLSMYRWNREASFGIKTAVNPSTSSLSTSASSGVNLTYSTLGFKLNIYNTTIDGDAGIEYEVIIPAKLSVTPSSFSFPIVSSGLTFYYQPPLNESEVIPKGWFANSTDIIDENGTVREHRPENVVGSYAVYGDKMNNEYGTGKALQLYRPQLIDVKGDTAWANMNIAGNVLTITLPQTFLNSAVYPVVIDPTFGYTNVGGTAISCTNIIVGSKFTCSSAGTADNITAFATCAIGTTGLEKYAIYDSSFKLLNTSSEVTVTSTHQWVTATFSAPKYSLSATTYELVGWGNYPSSFYHTYIYGDSNGTTNQGLSLSATYGTFPSTLSGFSNNTNVFSIYVNYTAAATGAEYSYSPHETLTVQGTTNKSAENAFTPSETVKVSGISSPYMIDRPYSLSNTLSLSSTVSKGIEKSFTSQNTATISAIISSGIEKAFTSSGVITSSTVSTSGIERQFSQSGILSLSSMVTSGMERLFSSVSSLILGSSSGLSQEKGYSPTSTVTITSTSTSGVEKSFAVSGVITTSGLSTSGIETGYSTSDSAILSDFFSMTSQTGLNLFYYLSETPKISALLGMGQEHLFNPSGTLGISDIIVSGLEKGFSFIESPTVLDSLRAWGEISLYPPGSGTSIIPLYPPSPSLPGVLNLKSILVVESYLPSFLSSLKSVYTFMLMMSYPAHISVMCAPPQTSTVNMNVVSVFNVPDLNYSQTITQALNGNQSVTEDVIVPLPFQGQSSYDYTVTTSYYYGNSLITQSSNSGTLTVQTWWIYLWAGIVTGLCLTFIGVCVGGYKLHEKRRKSKLKDAKAKQTIQQQQQTIQNLRKG